VAEETSAHKGKIRVMGTKDGRRVMALVFSGFHKAWEGERVSNLTPADHKM